MSTAPTLVLASTSRYRGALLARFGLPFAVEAPEVVETALAGETPVQTAARLALAKARAVAARRPDAVVVGSDQVADLDGIALGKPGDRAGAIAQLSAMSGRAVVFRTAVALVAPGSVDTAVDTTVVHLRRLDAATIERYVDADRPFDCAGSFRCEGLGIALFESIQGPDPTALVGLPLIATARLLRAAGFVLP